LSAIVNAAFFPDGVNLLVCGNEPAHTTRCYVRALDAEGVTFELEAEGLLAVAVQHENDHINGVLFIDHISKLKRDMVIKKFKKAAKKTEGAKPLSEDQEPSHHIG